jgi:hypothetical protein
VPTVNAWRVGYASRSATTPCRDASANLTSWLRLTIRKERSKTETGAVERLVNRLCRQRREILRDEINHPLILTSRVMCPFETRRGEHPEPHVPHPPRHLEPAGEIAIASSSRRVGISPHSHPAQDPRRASAARRHHTGLEYSKRRRKVRRLRRDPLEGPYANGRGHDGSWRAAPSDARPMFPDLGSRKARRLMARESHPQSHPDEAPSRSLAARPRERH